MTQPVATVDLGRLDAYRPATLDAAVWSANLAALSAEQPDLAEALRQTSLPRAWRPALALDDWVTYRLEQPGQPPAWLGNTAAPRTRAQALVGEFDPAGRNPALPCIGAGAELLVLLERLPAHVAVFAFNTDLKALAAVLRTQDPSAALTRGRCVLVPPGREAAFLTELLKAHPGLLPPGNILVPALIAGSRIEELRCICEEVHAEINQFRAQRLSELAAAAQAVTVRPVWEPRLAVLALNPHPTPRAVGCDLERAARRMGWRVLRRSVEDPYSAHALAHCEALAEFGPNLAIYVGPPHPALPLTPTAATCVWFLDAADVPAELPQDGRLRLAAWPRVAAALRRAGARPDTVLEWYWGCAAGAADQPVETPSEFVVLAADLPDHRPAAWGVTQATHQQLWERLRGTTEQVWGTSHVLQPEQLLVRAERECRVEITDRPLRERLVQLIERAVIPAVVLEQITRLLTGESVEVLALGRGWERLATSNLRPLAPELFALPERGAGLRPRAAVLAARYNRCGRPRKWCCGAGSAPAAVSRSIIRTSVGCEI